MKRIAFLSMVICFAGCATPKTAEEPGAPSLYLPKSCERTITRGPDSKITIPAGQYRPVFRDQGGVFYRGEAEIIGSMGAPLAGYLVYVTKDGRCAIASGSGSTIPNPLDRAVPFTSSR